MKTALSISDKKVLRHIRSLRHPYLTGFIILLMVPVLLHFSGFYKFPLDNLTLSKTSSIQLDDITSESGLKTYRRAPINDAVPNYLEVMGGGVAAGDIDGDGWEDIFFAGMPSINVTDDDMPSVVSISGEKSSLSSLFRNQGDGTFKNITAEAGLDSIRGFPMGALFFDFNNNGKQDLYVASHHGGQLFENMGGYFMDITEQAGLDLKGLCGEIACMAAAASAGDYDRDGYLDLLIVNNVNWDIDNPAHYGRGSLLPAPYQGQPAFLFRNNGDGTFTEVSNETGVTNRDSSGYREDGKGLSAVWSDFNNDGWIDIYIANDMSPNRLYINTGKGNFVETGGSGYVDELKSSMGVDAADYNLSGHMDLVTTNLKGIMTSLFRNYGNLRFDYATFYTGIMPSTRVSGWGTLFVDLDLDGYPDLVMGSGPIWNLVGETENIFFRNLGNGTFQDITKEIATFRNDQITRGLAIIDIDRSGTPDLIFSNIDGEPSQLLKNRSTGNNWVRIDLEGTVSNRDAVGARVTIEREDGLVQNQIVKAGNSYMSSGSKSLFFGMGKSAIKELIIQWPSGRTDTLNGLNVNEIVEIKEGEDLEAPLAVSSIKP